MLSYVAKWMYGKYDARCLCRSHLASLGVARPARPAPPPWRLVPGFDDPIGIEMEWDKSGKFGFIWEFGRGAFLADHKTFTRHAQAFARHLQDIRKKKKTAVGLSVGLSWDAGTDVETLGWCSNTDVGPEQRIARDCYRSMAMSLDSFVYHIKHGSKDVETLSNLSAAAFSDFSHWSACHRASERAAERWKIWKIWTNSGACLIHSVETSCVAKLKRPFVAWPIWRNKICATSGPLESFWARSGKAAALWASNRARLTWQTIIHYQRCQCQCLYILFYICAQMDI